MVENANLEELVCYECETNVQKEDRYCRNCGISLVGSIEEKGVNWHAVMAICLITITLFLAVFVVLYIKEEILFTWDSEKTQKSFYKNINPDKKKKLELAKIEYDILNREFRIMRAHKGDLKHDMDRTIMKRTLVVNAEKEFERRKKVIDIRLSYIDTVRTILNEEEFQAWFYIFLEETFWW